MRMLAITVMWLPQWYQITNRLSTCTSSDSPNTTITKFVMSFHIIFKERDWVAHSEANFKVNQRSN